MTIPNSQSYTRYHYLGFFILALLALACILYSLDRLYTHNKLKDHPAKFWNAHHPNDQAPFLIIDKRSFKNIILMLRNDQPDLVIAYHGEDLGWLEGLDPFLGRIYIYNKLPSANLKNYPKTLLPRTSINQLPDVGRDSHTYLTHIIKHYSSLSGDKRILFTLGNSQLPARFSTFFYQLFDQPFCLKSYPQNKLPAYHFPGEGVLNTVPNQNGLYRSQVTPAEDKNFGIWASKYLNIGPEELIKHRVCLWDGIFSARPSEIKAYPLSMYQKILASVSKHNSPEEGYYVSFAWHILFPQAYNSLFSER